MKRSDRNLLSFATLVALGACSSGGGSVTGDNNAGGDFRVYSDVKRTRLAKPDVVVVKVP